MTTVDRQIFQLQKELKRQQMERAKAIAEAKAFIRETRQEVETLKSQREQQIVEHPQQSIPPANENSATPKGGKYFKNGDRVPDNQELMRV